MTNIYLRLLLSILFFCCINLAKTNAQTPPNDECTDAISLTLGIQVDGTNIDATASLAEVDPVTGLGILAVCNPPNGFGVENAVWYTFQVENEGNHTLALTDATCAQSYAVYPTEDINCDNIFQSTLNGDQAFCVALGAGSDSTVMVMQEGMYYLIVDGAGGVACSFGLEVFEGPFCLPPDDVEVAANSTSAELSWESDGISFNIEWGETGFTQGAGTMFSTTDNPYNLESLTPFTTYDFYIQVDCGTEGISDLVGPFTFNTLPPAPICGGAFYDAGGEDNPYNSNANETYTICPDNTGDVVTVTFTLVDIESSTTAGSNGTGCWDYLSVYDGGDTDSAFLGDYCNSPDAAGSGLALDAGSSFTATNLSGCLTFTFTSDGSLQNAGWTADVTCAPGDPCPAPVALTASNITDSSAELSWSAALTIFDVEWGETGFAPGTGTTIPQVGNPANLTGLAAETAYDYYVCAICPDGMGGNITSECAGPFTFTTMVAAPTCTSGVFSDNGGTLNDYVASSSDSITICPDNMGDAVTVTFTFVDIETSVAAGNQDGCWDFLSIYDGTDTNNPLQETACGELDGDGDTPSVSESLLQAGDSFTSTDASGCLTFLFNSDGSAQEAGWEAIITCDGSTPCLPPNTLSAENITETSADLTWNSTETTFNVEWGTTGFAQGTGTSADGIVTPYNLTGLSPETSYDYYVCTVCENGEVSDCAGPFTFTTATPPPSCTSGIFYDNGGVMEDYASNSSDSITICPDSPNDAIVVTFTFVDIETSTGSGAQDGCWDFLSIYNGNNTSNPFQETACGELDGDGGTPSDPMSLLQAGDSFTSSDVSGCLTFLFNSDGSVQGAGWAATVACVPAVECPAELGLTTTSTSETSSNANNGTIDLSVNGDGTAPYTYTWSNGATVQDLVNLSAGEYCVTVADANGCTDSICEIISSSCADDWAFNAVVEYESGAEVNDGSIDINISGGLPPYNYAWNNGATSQDISGLSGGIYTVVVTDATGCTQVYDVEIGTDCPPNFSLIGQVMDMEIGLMNGAIDITVNGGSPPYTYSWSNGANTQDVSGLAAGSYSVVVTDAVGCNDGFAATIDAICPDNLGITSDITDESTSGAGDGAIDITVNGGTPPYIYSWNIGESTEDISGLNSGSYCVIVFDSGGCTANICFNIGEGCPDEIISTIEVTDETSMGDNDGEIDIDVFGGNPTYTYIWDNGSTDADQTDLAAGTYCVTVTDGMGCMQSTCAEVGNFCPPNLGVSAVVTNESIMTFSDGEIDITVNGGIAPYAYFWSNGQATQDLIGLAPGEYCVRVTDAQGCIENICFTIEDGCPPNFVTVVNINDVSISGLTDGGINQVLVNGTPPYNFAWNTGETTEDINGIGVGIYTVTITDADGCTEIAEYEVSPETCPDLITGVDITEISTVGGNNGSIDLTTNAGAQPLTYQWSNGSATQDLIGLDADRYFITVTDAAGCVTQAFYDLDEPVGIDNIDALTDVLLLPNPAKYSAQLSLTFDRNVDVQVSLMNVIGQVLDQRLQENISTTQFTFNTEKFAEGIYFIRIQADGQQVTKRLLVVE